MNSKNFKPVISLIIPVYDVEEYLRCCLDSVIAQTYDNLEIIVIDDGSLDNCGRICDEYAARDVRIRVIHQENAGVAAARNTGLDMAIGDYIGFVDSDDYLHPQMFEILLKNLLAAEADISVCNYQKVYNSDKQARRPEPEKTKVVARDEALNIIFGPAVARKGFSFPETDVVVWNKLYRKHLFDGLRFLKKYHEDLFITPHLVSRAQTMVFSEIPLYYYRQRSNSFINRAYNFDRLDDIEAHADRMTLFREKHSEHYPYAILAYLNSILRNYIALVHSGLLTMGLARQLRLKFVSAFKLPERKKLPFKMQFLFTLFLWNPVMYEMAIKVRQMIK